MNKTLKVSLVLFSIIFATSSFRTVSAREKTDSKANTKEVSIREVNKNTAQYVGKQVSVRGEIEKTHTPNLFTIDGDGILNDQIFVLIRDPGTQKGSKRQQAGTAVAFSEDDEIRATGTVRRMSVVDIERDFSLDLSPEIEVEFEGTAPVIVADSKNIQKISSEFSD